MQCSMQRVANKNDATSMTCSASLVACFQIHVKFLKAH